MSDCFYVIPEPARSKAIECIRGILVDRAKQKQLIYYSELISLISNIVELEPNSPSLHEMLGEISCSENEEGRGMLSVIVVDKDSHTPGLGFYRLAREECGRDIEDDDILYAKETDKVFSVWAK